MANYTRIKNLVTDWAKLRIPWREAISWLSKDLNGLIAAFNTTDDAVTAAQTDIDGFPDVLKTLTFDQDVDTTAAPTFDGLDLTDDPDLNNNHLIASQTILNQSAKAGVGLHGNGSSSKVTIVDDSELDYTNGMSAIVMFSPGPLSVGYQTLIDKKNSTSISGNPGYMARINISGNIQINYSDGTNGEELASYTSTTAITKGQIAIVGFCCGGNVAGQIWLNGKQEVSDGDVAGDLSNANNLYQFSRAGTAQFHNGSIYFVILFNRILTDEEFKKFTSSPLTQLDWADYGGSNVDLTSGIVIKGKKYRTETFVAGDDFSNIADTGASANVTGAEWTATGTTPTTWTNSSVLHQLGATAIYLAEDSDIDPDTGEAITLRDSSGNDNHGACTDVERFGGAVNEQQQNGTWTPANGDFGTWTTPTFTAKYKKKDGLVYLTLLQTGGTIDPGATGKYFTGVPFTPANVATCQATNGSYADLGSIHLATDGKLYFSDDIGVTTNLSFSMVYQTAE